jgi:hypothetical protein
MRPLSDNDSITGRLLAIGFSRQVIRLVFYPAGSPAGTSPEVFSPDRYRSGRDILMNLPCPSLHTAALSGEEDEE